MTDTEARKIVGRIEGQVIHLPGVRGAQVEVLTRDADGRSTYGVALLGGECRKFVALLKTVDEYTAYANR